MGIQTSKETLELIHPDIQSGDEDVTWEDKGIFKDVDLDTMHNNTWLRHTTQAATLAYKARKQEIPRDEIENRKYSDDSYSGTSFINSHFNGFFY